MKPLAPPPRRTRTGVARFIAAGALIAALAPARAAHADDAVPLIITGITLIGATFGWDVAFTAYDASHAVDGEEPDFAWMVAQTAVTSPQAVLGSVPMVLSQLEDRSDTAALFGVPFLPASVWANQMATFAVWSMASSSVDVGSRYGVSWMIAANLTFTTGAVASAFSDCHCTKPWFAVPTAAVAVGETIGSVYQAVNDVPHRAAWIGMSAWSGVLSLHAAGSLISYYVQTAKESVDYPYTPPYEPPPRPRPPPPRPRPPLEVPAPDPATPPAGSSLEDLDSPAPSAPRPARYKMQITGGGFAPITDGWTLAPGVSLSGRF